MKTKLFSISVLALLLCFASCESPIAPVKKAVFSGYAQKGPFINGSSVVISELDKDLNQTGRSYTTSITNNSGSFEQKQIELITNYIQLKADGYYFNEVSGKASLGQLTLYALADISQANSANVNVLTHLEKSRVEYLVQQDVVFTEAKKQAQREILAIFNMELPANTVSESLSLTDNAVLLAISCILQGHLSTADMSELMANIITDIKTDGTLDNSDLGSQLLDNARALNMADICKNLDAKFAELGLGNVTLPDFESLVQQFLDNTDYEPKTFITYPSTGRKGLNILAEDVLEINNKEFYSMKAEVPAGHSLKIIIKKNKRAEITHPLCPECYSIWAWTYEAIPNGPDNWRPEIYDEDAQTQEFNVVQAGSPSDLNILMYPGEVIIEFYEDGAKTPTRVKELKIPFKWTFSIPIQSSLIGDKGIASGARIIEDAQSWKELKNVMDLDLYVLEYFSVCNMIIIFDEVKSTGGWTIDITDAIEYEDRIVLNITNLEKGNGFAITTQPFSIYWIPKSNKELVFNYY